ncbi:MAG: transposase [Deltaproteobacteria bacterium]|nr:transposase [Deltaproteobacteria bacterium]
MSRYARIYFPGGLYHLVSKCVGNAPLLRLKKQREYYLQLLGESVQKTDAQILAYCILPTQAHLVVRAGWEPLERLMKPINTGYACWLNNSDEARDGAVFAGRYKSVLLEDNYVFDLVRYVHNGPVRAGKAKRAAESVLSSHQAYIGSVEAPAWLDTKTVLEMVNPKAGWAQRQFDQFVDEGAAEGRRRDLEGSKSDAMSRAYRAVLAEHHKIDGPILGSEEFVEMVYQEVYARGSKSKRRHPSRTELNRLVDTVREIVNIDAKDFMRYPKRKPCALARKIIVYLWVVEYGGKQSDVARKIKASTGAVTRWYGKVIQHIEDFEPLIVKVQQKLKS